MIELSKLMEIDQTAVPDKKSPDVIHITVNKESQLWEIFQVVHNDYDKVYKTNFPHAGEHYVKLPIYRKLQGELGMLQEKYKELEKEKRILEVMVHTLKNPPSGEGPVKNTLEINHPVMLLNNETGEIHTTELLAKNLNIAGFPQFKPVAFKDYSSQEATPFSTEGDLPIATGTKINLIKSEQLKFPFIADVLSEGAVPSGNKTTVSINKDGSLDVKFPIQASNPPITGTPKED